MRSQFAESHKQSVLNIGDWIYHDESHWILITITQVSVILWQPPHCDVKNQRGGMRYETHEVMEDLELAPTCMRNRWSYDTLKTLARENDTLVLHLPSVW